MIGNSDHSGGDGEQQPLLPIPGLSPATVDPAAGPAPPVAIHDRDTARWEYGTFPRVVGEFWTSRQRRMDPLHYLLSYRASFKPELPDYFIRRFTRPGEIVLDPFAGRGTTALQANILGRAAYAADVNPLSQIVIETRSRPVTASAVAARLAEIDLEAAVEVPARPDLSMFYHAETLRELTALKRHLAGHRTDADRMIELLALSRLHGHSSGFFSVYSFPQISVPPAGQVRINARRRQAPEYRPLAPRILRKARATLHPPTLAAIAAVARRNRVVCCDARQLVGLPHSAARLVVTSPPFLDKANYLLDNWLEYWFLGIDPASLRGRILQTGRMTVWRAFMADAMAEMYRVLRPGGVAAIEVGEVARGRGRSVNLDEVLLEELARLRAEGRAPFEVLEVMIHSQQFTKLAHCFGVVNNRSGTNSHRILILGRP